MSLIDEIKGVFNGLSDNAINDIEDLLKEHLKNQPYAIKCSNCGAELAIFDSDIDNDFDISIDVDPCDCLRRNNI